MGELHSTQWLIGLAFIGAIIGIPWLAYRHSRKAADQNRAPYRDFIVCLVFTTLAVAIGVFSIVLGAGQDTGDAYGPYRPGTIAWLFLAVMAGQWTGRTWYQILRVEPEPAFRKKHRSFVLAAGIAICPLLVYSCYVGVRARHVTRIDNLLKQFTAPDEKAVAAKQRFAQAVRQETHTVPEYLERCRELELALDDFEPYLRRGDRLLDEMSYELQYFKADRKHASLISTVNVLHKVTDKDIELARALRKEVDYAKRLAALATADNQARFYKANILPVKSDEKRIGNEEIEILKDAKARGIDLGELYREVGVQ